MTSDDCTLSRALEGRSSLAPDDLVWFQRDGLGAGGTIGESGKEQSWLHSNARTVPCLRTMFLKVRVRKQLASFIFTVTNAMSKCEDNGTMLAIKCQVPPRKDDRVILHFDCTYMTCKEQIEHAAC